MVIIRRVESRQSRLAKAASVAPSGGMIVRKVHMTVARSTCGSEKCQLSATVNRVNFWNLSGPTSAHLEMNSFQLCQGGSACGT